MFYFKSKNGTEYKFDLVNINDRLIIDYSRKIKTNGYVVTLGGLLYVTDNKVDWTEDRLDEFDDDIKNYIQKIVKLKVFI